MVSTFEQGLKRWRGVGSLFWLFLEMKCLFFVAPEARFGEIMGVFLTKKHSLDVDRGA